MEYVTMPFTCQVVKAREYILDPVVPGSVEET